MKSNPRPLAAALLAGLLPLAASAAETLTALGRVLPRSGIVDVAGVAGDTIEAISVREGDWVEAGQSLGTLSSAREARRRLAQAEADLAASRQSHEREAELARQRIALAENEARIAEERFKRIDAARTSEFVSPDQVEARTLDRQSTAVKLAAARRELEKITSDADKAARTTEAEITAARTQLNAAELRAPLKARVLKCNARPGGIVGRTELLRLGNTAEMIVVAEVYEADILKVKAGQKVTVSSPALPKSVTGVVESVSQMVFRNALESVDPNAGTQGRVVEVTVRMDEASPLDRLVLLQVDVVINLGQG
ncbi:MAG: HlyD family efflux transporter periplasmic adaptor subunit [Verrucomicrobia bacterium]|nr:HlyD family efflux transporter periplasmic adaptor subunit [Verrucomicrobiota bacterium]